MIKIISILATLCISFSAFSLDKYSTADPGAKKVIERILKELKITEKDVPQILYDKIDYVFEDSGKWHTYWFGYQDVASSKIENPNITFIEYFINTEKQGTYFLSFMYDSTSKQILLSSKQIRYSDKQTVLDAFKETKNDTENSEIKHESDNYALTQTINKVDFAAYNIGISSGSVVYMDQKIIQL